MKPTCSTCKFVRLDAQFTKSGNYCPILKTEVSPQEDTCPLHQKELIECAICGQLLLKGTGAYSEELGAWVCDTCTPHLYTCATCKNRHNNAPRCVMEQYHGDKPILIQVTRRQGILTMTGTQLNPEVLDEVCPTCTCGSPWNCQRNHKCNNWEVRIYD